MAAATPDPDLLWKVGNAVLAGAVDAFTLSGVPVPALQYVTSRGPVLLETDCGCDQLYVQLGDIVDPAEFAVPKERCASQFAVSVNVVFGMCITEFVGNQGTPCSQPIGDPGDPCGDPFVPPAGPATPANPNSLAYETWLAARIKWVMANGVARCVEESLCACIGPPNGRLCHATAQRGEVTGFAEGLCEWSDLALTVTV